jgi:hypothetical protein
VRPCWSGYSAVADIDAVTSQVAQAGGSLHKPPSEIPGVGRFSLVADPDGAMFILFKPNSGGISKAHHLKESLSSIASLTPALLNCRRTVAAAPLT